MRWSSLRRLLYVFGLGTLVLTALISSPPASANQQERAGAVYALTNAPTGNEVVVWNRAADGTLSEAGRYPTGGNGSGAGLGSQNAIVISKNDRWLFAVNAGSNSISSFRIEENGLSLVGSFPSGGQQPTSLTVDRRLLYVLNAGDSGNITGFSIERNGSLTPLANSTRPLSGAATQPAQVSFSPDGDLLVVTERATQLIDTYTVGRDGLANGPISTRSSGVTPFGFAFGKRNQLIVSEANAGTPNGSTASSYILDDSGSLQLVSGSVATLQTAACWVVVTSNGRYAYTSNAGSGTISGFRISRSGSLTMLNSDGRTGVTGDNTGPVDMALSDDNRFLYVRNGRTGTIGAFVVRIDGSLQPLPSVGTLPPNAAGLAAR